MYYNKTVVHSGHNHIVVVVVVVVIIIVMWLLYDKESTIIKNKISTFSVVCVPGAGNARLCLLFRLEDKSDMI